MGERWWIDLQSLREKNPEKYDLLTPEMLTAAGPDRDDSGDVLRRERILHDQKGATRPYDFADTEPLPTRERQTEWEIYDRDHEDVFERVWLAIGAVCVLVIAGWRSTRPARLWLWARLEPLLLAVLRWFYEDSLDWLQDGIYAADRRSKTLGRWASRRLRPIGWSIADQARAVSRNFQHWKIERKTELGLVKAARKAAEARSFPGLSGWAVALAFLCTESVWFMRTFVSKWDYVPTYEGWRLMLKFNSDDFSKMFLTALLTGIALACVHRLTIDRRRRLYFLNLMKRRPVLLGRLSAIGAAMAAVVTFLPLPALLV